MGKKWIVYLLFLFSLAFILTTCGGGGGGGDGTTLPAAGLWDSSQWDNATWGP